MNKETVRRKSEDRGKARLKVKGEGEKVEMERKNEQEADRWSKGEQY